MPNALNNVTGRMVGGAIIVPAVVAVTGGGIFGAAGLIQGTGLLIAGAGTSVLPAIGTGLGATLGSFGAAGAAAATTSAFGVAGGAVAAAGATVAGFGATALAAASTTVVSASSTIVTGSGAALTAVGLSVSWLPPVAIAIAAVLVAPAIAGGVYEAIARAKTIYDRVPGPFFLKLVVAVLIGTLLSPLNFISGFFRTGWNMLKGKGYVGSFKATRDQIKADIARENTQKSSILGAMLPKTFDRVVGLVVGLGSGIAGNLMKSYNSIGKAYDNYGLLGLIGSGIVGIVRLIALPWHMLQGAERGLIAGSTAAKDTMKHISTSFKERVEAPAVQRANDVALARWSNLLQARAVAAVAQREFAATKTPQEMVLAMRAIGASGTSAGIAVIQAAQTAAARGGPSQEVNEAAQAAVTQFEMLYQTAYKEATALKYKADTEVGLSAVGIVNKYDYAALEGQVAKKQEQSRILRKKTAEILTGLRVGPIPDIKLAAFVQAQEGKTTRRTEEKWKKAHSLLTRRDILQKETVKAEKALNSPGSAEHKQLLAPSRKR